MGMDAVEIVMAVEDAFDIQIEDSEAEKLLTPGQLIDLVMSKVATTNTDICLTHRSFNLLRRFLVRQCGLARKQVKPETTLRAAIPRTQRRLQLQQLSAELAMHSHPELERPEWLKALLWGLALLTGLAVAISLAHSKLPVWLPSLLAAIATGYMGVAATENRRTEFPKELATVGEFARWIMTHKGRSCRCAPPKLGTQPGRCAGPRDGCEHSGLRLHLPRRRSLCAGPWIELIFPLSASDASLHSELHVH
jgi:hypothetical protein